MAFYTKTEARAAAQSVSQGLLKKAFSETIMESVQATTDNDKFDIFLSHSIHDSELIIGVKRLLEKQGFSVYVDWDADPQLDRNAVSKKTAETLRRRMKQSNSLIYVATEKASSSKWMPWELGFFDGHKPDQVAVLPLLETEQTKFPTQEYLNLYPVVTKSSFNNGRKDIFVEDFSNRWMTLVRFAKSTGTWQQYINT